MAIAKHLARLLALVLFASAASASAQPVSLRFDRTDAQARYAAERITDVLRERKLQVAERARPGDFRITLATEPRGLKPEAFAIRPGARSLQISGGDGRGVIYGALSVAEQLRNGTALSAIGARREEAALPFRAIKFNLPWDSYRSSSALDLHYDTARDPKFWEAFLDMMAENRFNALSLWNLHPFPYMIRARNYPEASRFSDAELAEWRKLYTAIFAMAKERGIETYLVNWNILVSPEFAKAHKLEKVGTYPNYKGPGDTSELVKRYNRESVTQVLDEYPDLTGFGFSFGEQMEGMTPRERQEWMDETIIAGMQAAKRPTKMIFRAPFSADLGQGGSTDVATEKLTREAIERLEGKVVEPVWMEIKFNWSHGHSATELVKVHGGPLTDAYFNPLPENYKVAWMMRNEDFYALRWGSPAFIREHIERNGRQPYVGGYFIGSENYIPAKDYFTAPGAPVAWTYAFERQWLFYKLWGRMLYNPATPDAVFEDEFARRYGSAARPLLRAYELASQTQLQFASSVDFSWDFTLYGEGMMAFGRGIELVSVDRLIAQRPLTNDRLSVREFVATQVSGAALPTGKTTPVAVADRLTRDAAQALRLVEPIGTTGNRTLLFEVADVKAWANLGLYFAEKLRGAVALERFRTSGNEADKQAAIAHLETSLGYWDEVVAITRPLYADMPLAHYNPPNNARNDNNLFHWARLRPAVAKDVDVAKAATYHASPSGRVAGERGR
jgi:hypothetical protein